MKYLLLIGLLFLTSCSKKIDPTVCYMMEGDPEIYAVKKMYYNPDTVIIQNVNKMVKVAVPSKEFYDHFTRTISCDAAQDLNKW